MTGCAQRWGKGEVVRSEMVRCFPTLQPGRACKRGQLVTLCLPGLAQVHALPDLVIHFITGALACLPGNGGDENPGPSTALRRVGAQGLGRKVQEG